jgi:hypothetical protein
MKLKNINPNGDNVVASNIINEKKIIFTKIVDIEFENEFHLLLFL